MRHISLKGEELFLELFFQPGRQPSEANPVSAPTASRYGLSWLLVSNTTALVANRFYTRSVWRGLPSLVSNFDIGMDDRFGHSAASGHRHCLVVDNL